MSRHCYLFVNDTPREGENPGTMTYIAEDQQVVAVSFIAANGRAVRASFNPQTGDASVYDLGYDLGEDEAERRGRGWLDGFVIGVRAARAARQQDTEGR